jgi:hypothetical protein
MSETTISPSAASASPAAPAVALPPSSSPRLRLGSSIQSNPITAAQSSRRELVFMPHSRLRGSANKRRLGAERRIGSPTIGWQGLSLTNIRVGPASINRCALVKGSRGTIIGHYR